MDESHAAVGAGTRFGIDELRLGGGQGGEISAQVAGPKADVVQPFSVPRQEAGDPARIVGRLDELDAS